MKTCLVAHTRSARRPISEARGLPKPGNDVAPKYTGPVTLPAILGPLPVRYRDTETGHGILCVCGIRVNCGRDRPTRRDDGGRERWTQLSKARVGYYLAYNPNSSNAEENKGISVYKTIQALGAMHFPLLDRFTCYLRKG